ncbi:MAG: hypothetical protein KF833_23910 [Verrucomicrobiae bacterium]|nr:hypothetical protein [Verrucomicrobiae bacterium]
MTSHRTSTSWRRLAVAGALAPTVATVGLAADFGAGPGPERSANRVSLSARFLFNVSAEFAHRASPADPGPAIDVRGIDRLYDNGHVRVDDSGNAGGRTWNWAYDDPASLDGTVLHLHSVRSPADGLTQREKDDPHYGFEIAYDRVLTRFPLGRTGTVHAGLRGAFGTAFLDIRHQATVSGMTTGIRDSYDLSGLPLIPNAPYLGGAPEPGGPLPLLIPDAPFDRQTVETPATATQRLQIDGELYGFKLGPFLEIPLGRSASFQIQGGLLSVLADTEFTFGESLGTGGGTTLRARATDWCWGGFVEGQFGVALTDRWTAFAGAGWQGSGSQSLAAGPTTARLGLGNVVTAFLGVGVAF